MTTVTPPPLKRTTRAPWSTPSLRRLDAANAELGLRPITPEGQAMGS